MEKVALLFLLFYSSVNAIITDEQLAENFNDKGANVNIFFDVIAEIASDNSNFEISKASRRKWIDDLSDTIARIILYLYKASLMDLKVLSPRILSGKDIENIFFTKYDSLDTLAKKKLAIVAYIIFKQVMTVVYTYADVHEYGVDSFKKVVFGVFSNDEFLLTFYARETSFVFKEVCKKLNANSSKLEYEGLVDLCNNYESYIEGFKNDQEKYLKAKKIRLTAVAVGGLASAGYGFVQLKKVKDKKDAPRKEYVKPVIFCGGGLAVLGGALWKVLNN